MKTLVFPTSFMEPPFHSFLEIHRNESLFAQSRADLIINSVISGRALKSELSKFYCADSSSSTRERLLKVDISSFMSAL